MSVSQVAATFAQIRRGWDTEWAPLKVVVVGLGAVGSAVLYQLARGGASVTGIDSYLPPYRFGSSHARHP